MVLEITDECTICGTCLEECPIDSIEEGTDKYIIDQTHCTECDACFYVCPGGHILKIKN